MLSIGAQGGTSNPQSDRHSRSEPFANMAVQHQPSRGTTHLTQQLGSYLITSPRSAMTAISSGQPGHIAMTAIDEICSIQNQQW
jgi:hypothetical protein